MSNCHWYHHVYIYIYTIPLFALGQFGRICQNVDVRELFSCQLKLRGVAGDLPLLGEHRPTAGALDLNSSTYFLGSKLWPIPILMNLWTFWRDEFQVMSRFCLSWILGIKEQKFAGSIIEVPLEPTITSPGFPNGGLAGWSWWFRSSKST